MKHIKQVIHQSKNTKNKYLNVGQIFEWTTQECLKVGWDINVHQISLFCLIFCTIGESYQDGESNVLDDFAWCIVRLVDP